MLIGTGETAHRLRTGRHRPLGAYFEAVSKRLGVELSPPERFVDQVAHAFLGAGQADKAIELFKFNVARHAKSSNTYSSLAQAYAAKGDVSLARENYEMSLRMNPDNQEVRKQLSDLMRNR